MAIYIKAPGDDVFKQLMESTDKIIEAVKYRRMFNTQLAENARSVVAQTDPERRATAIDALEADPNYARLKNAGFFDQLRKTYATPTTRETAQNAEAQSARLRTVGYTGNDSWVYPQFTNFDAKNNVGLVNKTHTFVPVTDEMRAEALQLANGDVAKANAILQRNALARSAAEGNEEQQNVNLALGQSELQPIAGAATSANAKIVEQEIPYEEFHNQANIGKQTLNKRLAIDVTAPIDEKYLVFPTTKEAYAQRERDIQARNALQMHKTSLQANIEPNVTNAVLQNSREGMNAQLAAGQESGISREALAAAMTRYLQAPISVFYSMPPREQLQLIDEATHWYDTRIANLGKQLASDPNVAEQTGIDPMTGLEGRLPIGGGATAPALGTVQVKSEAQPVLSSPAPPPNPQPDRSTMYSAAIAGVLNSSPTLRAQFPTVGSLAALNSMELADLASKTTNPIDQFAIRHLAINRLIIEQEAAKAAAAQGGKGGK